MRKAPMVNAAIDFDAPRSVADNGPIDVSKVDVVKVSAHAKAKNTIFQYGFSGN
eukprot:CAMPEP_0175007662 /NCGR_PEP_ID=MMETSP0005-20121125/6543_1 /TAXON_ID=420556 /ORGANISM="Ochromonas sp., Strain CCMP1393" /LENGTH=53 /DNA_ID=CAMNT_0016263143 /DNA_START=468 /DNA_END=626 /DNA_ORIENTATION=+